MTVRGLSVLLVLSLLVAPTEVQSAPISPVSNSLINFTWYGWSWSPDYAEYGIGNATLAVVNGTVTVRSFAPEVWDLYFPMSQLNITIQPGVTETFLLNLNGTRVRSTFRLGQISFPITTDIRGFWLENNYTLAYGEMFLAVKGEVFNATRPYYLVLRTPGISVETKSPTLSFAENVDAIIHNSLNIFEQMEPLFEAIRNSLSRLLIRMLTIYEEVRKLIDPYIP